MSSKISKISKIFEDLQNSRLTDDEQNKKSTCGTVSYMPAVFGCYLAEYVIKRL